MTDLFHNPPCPPSLKALALLARGYVTTLPDSDQTLFRRYLAMSRASIKRAGEPAALALMVAVYEHYDNQTEDTP